MSEELVIISRFNSPRIISAKRHADFFLSFINSPGSEQDFDDIIEKHPSCVDFKKNTEPALSKLVENESEERWGQGTTPDDLKWRQERLRRFLDDVIEHGISYAYKENLGLCHILERYFLCVQDRVRLTEKGVERIPIMQLSANSSVYEVLWLEVVCSLFTYLEAEGAEKLHRCFWCKSYFAAKTRREQFYCGKSCRYAHHYQNKVQEK